MLGRVIYLISGILFIIKGFSFFENQYFYWYGAAHYLGKGRYLVAIAGIIVGILIFLIALRKNFKPFWVDTSKTFKCIKCGNVFEKKDSNAFECPDCGGELDDLDGFFERHPELKEANKSN